MRKQDKRWRTNPELWEKIKPIAHEKRKQPTEAEQKLWTYLRKHQLRGAKFRSQHCVGKFIVDFYCRDAKLVIEVDGPIHQYQEEEDKIRQEYLEDCKLKVLRFTNDLILNNIEKSIEQIESYLSRTL
jgi:very-short-patch-repair endonuclease